MAKSRINYFRQYLSFQLGRLKACTIFSIIFSTLGFPALVVTEYISSHTKAYDPLAISLYVVAVIAILGCGAMSFITPIISFQHLFTKVKADNILSLPLTTSQRFFADISATYISFHLPFAISSVIAYLLDIGITESNDWLSRQEYFYAFAALGIMLMFSALNIAIMTCCGRIVEAILYPILINIVMPLLISFGGYIAFKNCIGLYSGIEYEITYSPLFLMWPLGALKNISTFVYLFIVAPIATIVYIAASFLGYKMRKAENIGKPFVFKPVYLIFSTVIALTMIVGYTYLTDYATIEGDNIIPSILTLGLILLILMLIIEVIHSKKIKNIFAFAARFGAILVGGLLLCFGLLLSEGFGAGYYVPDAKSVKSVSVSNTNVYDSGFYNYVFSDEEDIIQLVTAEHEKILDKTDNTDSDDNSFSISYTLNSGKTVNRIYSRKIVSDNFWNTVFTTEGYRLSPLNNLYYDMEMDREHFSTLSTIRLSNEYSSKLYLEADIGDVSESGLLDALEKDLRADTEYSRHDENSIGLLQIGKYYEYFDETSWEYNENFSPYHIFTIYENYTNTIDFLKKYGTVPTAAESLDDSSKNSKVYTLIRTTTGPIDQSYQNNMWSQDYEAIFITEEEFKELIQHQAGYHNLSDDGYIYAVCKGISSRIPKTEGYTQESDDYVKMLNEIGIYYDNYDFFEDTEIISNTDIFLSENYNSRCSEIFNSRTSFSYFYDRLIY